MKKAELIFIPSPAIGHLVSAAEIAKQLVDRDDRLSITMLIMKLPFDPKLSAYTNSLVASSTIISERLKFVQLPQNDAVAESDPGVFMSSFLVDQKPHVKNVVTQLMAPNCSNAADSNESPRVAGFVVDMFCTMMADVAAEFGVPTYVFFTSSAGFLGLLFHLKSLRDDRNVDPTEFKNDPEAELDVPSFVKSVPASVLPGVLLEETSMSLFLGYAGKIREAKGILVNTCMELESHAIHSLSYGGSPPVYPVGPVLNLGDGVRNVLSSSTTAESSDDIIRWLDEQPNSSVVFLCFGSAGSFGEDQVKEIACALEHGGARFLWSLRRPSRDDEDDYPTDYQDPKEVLPEGFLDRTTERGKVIGWAPQVAILSHPAIGGFVSHCGWNSILESLWFGVPVTTWPLYAEQQLNAFEMVKELGLAVEMKLDYRSRNNPTVVKAEEIDGAIRRLMEPASDIRKRVKEMSEQSRKAVLLNGSSHSVLGHLINDVLDIEKIDGAARRLMKPDGDLSKKGIKEMSDEKAKGSYY